MERPEGLFSTTIGETRREIKKNLKALEELGWTLTNGFCDIPSSCERWINITMTNFVVQQEYLRECESANWGWDRKIVDFSKTA